MQPPEETSAGDGSAGSLFADRVDESVALARSLRSHEERVRSSTIDPREAYSVLTFHGVGGVGKTKLSERLEDWLKGTPGDYGDWGPRPVGPLDTVLTVRWNLNDSRGNVDVVDLMVALRAGLVGSRLRWRAFDLAFAAYLSAVDPGQTFNLRGFRDFSGDLLDVLGDLASEFKVPGWAGSLSSAALRPWLERAVAAAQRHHELGRIASLGPTLEACTRLQAREPSPEVAAKVAWVLTDEIEALPPEQRPLLVVFIDTFERVQAEDARSAEEALNRLVAHLPFALFVITGRRSVDWHKPSRTNLLAAGARRWPSLVPGRTDEPRQHLIGRLSAEDSLAVFRQRRALGGWPMDETLLPALVDKTAGLPLHMDAVCKLADNLTSDGVAEITAIDVVRDLPDLVRRLVEDLTDEQSRAFHAACLLPYFDIPLAAAVGGVPHAAVEACTHRALVEDNPSSRYRFRVHDRIREVVRRAGCDVKGGWTEADWHQAALRGYAEAQRRHDEAAASGDDRAVMEAIGLGLALAVDYALPGGWLSEAVREAPTIRGLRPLSPTVDDTKAGEGVALVRLITAVDAPRETRSVEELRALRDGGSAVAPLASRWLAYRLRSLQRREEALEVFREHKALFPDQKPYADHQISVTLRQLRRFRDAIDYRAEHGLAPLGAPIRRHHGHDTGDLAKRLAQAQRQNSKRFGFELYTAAYSEEARFRPVPETVVSGIIDRSINLGAPEREADGWIVRGYQYLHDEARFEEVIDRLVAIGRRQSTFGRISVTRLLALRARVTGSAAYADRAAAEAALAPPFRTAGWIFTDFALELIGRPLPDVPTQWLEPVEDVRVRWYAAIDDIIERSRRGRIVV